MYSLVSNNNRLDSSSFMNGIHLRLVDRRNFLRLSLFFFVICLMGYRDLIFVEEVFAFLPLPFSYSTLLD
jgi:predicted membrane channel-forming protein YqfA (hemolysin III family)